MRLKLLWQRWGELVRRLVTLAASVGSLVGLLLKFLPSADTLFGWNLALLVSAAFFLIVLVVLEVLAHRRHRVYATNDVRGIREYMHSWIEHGGRVAIWTRDMSWAQNQNTRRLLIQKAERGELILCLPQRNDLASELAAAGAEVCAYGTELLESPASRFTITFFGRDGARLAVGRAVGDTHSIDEFNSGDHPAFHVAEDLIGLVRKQCVERRNG